MSSLVQEVVVVARSSIVRKALANGNSTATAFANFMTTSIDPSGDGVYPIGQAGDVAADRLFLMPYAEGGSGSNFSVRVYGWTTIKGQTPSDQKTWIPFLLAELACISCNVNGVMPATAGDPSQLLDSEYMCDTISLTQGSIGPQGLINSTGPGTNLVAFAKIDLAGCRVLQFDFQQTDPVGMNCLWAKG